MDLSLNVRGIVSQRLIPTLDDKRSAAIEILLGTPMISDLILKGEFGLIKEIMEKSENVGMQTFDGALYKLFKQGRISLDEAIRNADSQNNLRLRINLNAKKDTLGDDKDGGPMSSLSLEETNEDTGNSMQRGAKR